MKRFVTALASALIGLTAGAQYYQDAVNVEMLRHLGHDAWFRKEIVMPQVGGYNVYKADLHTHTVFSDGWVLPDFRVAEAWQDGLDVMAVTEHIEYRPYDKVFADNLKEFVNQETTADIGASDGRKMDLNYSVNRSLKAAEGYDITIIPGTEITRSGTYVGHFNALFTSDNNLVYDEDPVKAVRNAKAQNAVVMHNHPGWTRKNIDFTEAEKVIYAEGLVDGVEVMNGGEFYPGVIDRVRERGLFIAANSDIHSSTAIDYKDGGNLRPMTLIFAKDRSLESLKEALLAGRTLAYGFYTLCGDEQLLKDFFLACIQVKVIREKDDRYDLMITNTTSVPFTLQKTGSNYVKLSPFTSIRLSFSKNDMKVTVLNMFCSADRHPVVEIAL